jgi:Leucine-rich repeat (LRR) protein
MSQEAETRVETALRDNSTVLDLSGLRMRGLPPSLADLVDVVDLDLSDNQLTELPEWLGNISCLTRLVLRGNQLVEAPASLGNLVQLTTLDLGENRLSAVPIWVRRLTNLTALDLNSNRLTQAPEWLGELTALTRLRLDQNHLDCLPASLANLRSLSRLDLENNDLAELPRWLGQLTNLTELHLGGDQLSALPDWMASLTNLTELYLYNNQLTKLPDWMVNLTGLTTLWLGGNQLTDLPDWMASLTSLTELHLGGNQLTELPGWMASLTGLARLYLGGNQLSALPDWMANLTSLTTLDLSGNQLTELPDWIGNLTRLNTLDLDGNQLAGLPFSLADLRLRRLGVAGNPLAPELQAAYQDSTDELMRFLRLLRDDGVFVREAKLVLVGEGAVGKSSLLAALRGEEWVEQRSTTHGIEVKPLQVAAAAPIILNGWDFGGQSVYRPTHQLFFTAPAVYLVVWKPREGPEQGFVDYWIKLIKHRAGAAARVHVVATHGGPLQRSAHIDEAALRDRYGDMIVGFHHVDSRTGLNIGALRRAIADTAAALPHIGRWYPESWQRLRTELRERGEPYLSYPAYEAVALAQGLGATSARSLAKNAHALGHWIHSAGDPGLADLVIFKADWLAAAISLVLDDPATIDANGLLPHRLLPGIWDNPGRGKALRYPSAVHQVFVQLMEKFDISYRVTDGSDRLEPTSLVAQLVRADRPDLTTAWHDYGRDREETNPHL